MIKKLTIEALNQIKDSQNIPYSTNQLKVMLLNINYFNIGYFLKERLIGYILTNVTDQIDIIWIYVDKEYRRQGYASELIDYLSKKVNRSIMIEVNENNIEAINLYKKMGFELINIRKNYYPHNQNALIMKRKKKCS
jgi:ribosomal-protein-alanine N-acetyltransferase